MSEVWDGVYKSALDCSLAGIELLNKKALSKGLKIKYRVFDVRHPLPFPDSYSDAAYASMVLNMRFSKAEIYNLLSEIRMALKPNGLNLVSVRNNHDKFYGKGVKIEDGVYNINGFEIRFFSEKEIDDLVSEENFKALWIKEEHEEPVTLYLVYYTSKQK